MRKNSEFHSIKCTPTDKRYTYLHATVDHDEGFKLGWLHLGYGLGLAYYAYFFTHYAMLQCSKFWPIMLNIMLKNKNCAQHIIY